MSVPVIKRYKEKLKDPRWQKLRLQVMERDDFTCQYCDDKETELQIHHLSYLENPWDVDMSQLVTLCKDCHGFMEYRIKNKQHFSLPIFKIKIADSKVVSFLFPSEDSTKEDPKFTFTNGWNGFNFQSSYIHTRNFFMECAKKLDDIYNKDLPE